MRWERFNFDPLPQAPKPPSGRERVLLRMALGFTLVLLVLPVSADAIVDAVRYLAGR